MNNRIDAIYARQSVDKKDSISIESQIEFCKYELKGGNWSSSFMRCFANMPINGRKRKPGHNSRSHR